MPWTEITPPVRPCCGQRHRGVTCPDGTVLCCLCFSRVTKDQLERGADGTLRDICHDCDEHEQARKKRCSMQREGQ